MRGQPRADARRADRFIHPQVLGATALCLLKRAQGRQSAPLGLSAADDLNPTAEPLSVCHFSVNGTRSARRLAGLLVFSFFREQQARSARSLPLLPLLLTAAQPRAGEVRKHDAFTAFADKPGSGLTTWCTYPAKESQSECRKVCCVCHLLGENLSGHRRLLQDSIINTAWT